MKYSFPILLTLSLAALVTFVAGGGHGSYLPAKLIFPYSMLAAQLLGAINIIPMLLGVVQIPLYFFLIRRDKKLIYIVLAIHILAIYGCFNLGEQIF